MPTHVRDLFSSENFEESRRRSYKRHQRLCVPAHRDRVLVRDKRVRENLLTSESSKKVVDYCGTGLQREVAPHMRKIVTDWMMEVCEDQQCQPQVFFLAVSYLDRVLSSLNIKKNQFQLLAAVCILLASKFSQVVPITTEQLVIYTDNSVTVEELKSWELFVLEILGWELYTPTAHDFLDHLGKCDADIKRQAETIAAMAATEYKFIAAKQSVIAAASLAAAVQQSQKESEKMENVIELSSSMFKCSRTEIIFFMRHILELSPSFISVSLKSEPVSIEYFTETKTQHSSNSSLSLTPTDTIRFEVLAA